MKATSVRVGTSGWSYPNGQGSWNGVFYPPRRAGGFRAGEELAYYAEHFDTVEVNSTFYRPPEARVARRWVEQTPRDFRFSVKLYQAFTHPGMHGRGRNDPSQPGSSPVPDPSRADFEQFLAGIDPVVSSGKLGMLLVQFPPAFHLTDESRDYLHALLASLGDLPLAVELRHRSWSDARAVTESLLAEFGATWVQIDEPKFRLSIRQDLRDSRSPGYYLRLHGRNAANWWKHDSPDDRYNYLYSAGEVNEFAEAVRAADTRVDKTYVYFNNHFAAKGVVNATELKHQLGQPLKGEYRRELVDRYPELKAIVGLGLSDLLP
jgi:uncharacterized protein YecE (DUF72 family)